MKRRLCIGGCGREGATLKERIVRRAGELAMKNGDLATRNKLVADSSQRAQVAQMLNACFPNDPMADKKRHDVLKSLTGYATVDRVPDLVVLAMLWCLCRVEEGRFVLDERAAEEVRGVVC